MLCELDRCPPKAKVTRSNRVGCASLSLFYSELVVDIVDREKPTIRQLVQRLAGARGYWVIARPPEKIADNIQTWFENGGADGFNVMPPWLPGGFDIFAEQVVPILRKRGLFRHDYTGTTLRDHYGLNRPASVFSNAIQAIA
jgi:alkanesulfonate monooxygenase SsuD/methylene tetrahydromethanopterin reductase-like flavin-dependent oxidoreductase (luciferase family)